MSLVITSETPCCAASAKVSGGNLRSYKATDGGGGQSTWYDLVSWSSFYFQIFMTCHCWGFSAFGTCWAKFTCWKPLIMICNSSCPVCHCPLSLVSKKHSHMFKIGQFHSVDQPRLNMGPLGLSYYGSLDPFCVDQDSTVTVGKEEWVCLDGSRCSSRFSLSSGDLLQNVSFVTRNK